MGKAGTQGDKRRKTGSCRTYLQKAGSRRASYKLRNRRKK
jgi:hypothetical protein